MGAPRELLQIDQITGRFLDELTNDSGYTQLHFAVEGTLAEPDVSFDMGQITSAATGAIKGEVGERVDRQKERLGRKVRSEVDEAKQGLRDRLHRD